MIGFPLADGAALEADDARADAGALALLECNETEVETVTLVAALVKEAGEFADALVELKGKAALRTGRLFRLVCATSEAVSSFLEKWAGQARAAVDSSEKESNEWTPRTDMATKESDRSSRFE